MYNIFALGVSRYIDTSIIIVSGNKIRYHAIITSLTKEDKDLTAIYRRLQNVNGAKHSR